MSHMVKVKDFSIVSLHALKAACRRLGFELDLEAKQARFWNGRRYACEHVIRVPGVDWDIAVEKNGREYTLSADFYGNVGKKLKEAVGQLRQMYAVELAKQEARKKGYSVREQKLADGSIRLVVEVRHV